MDGAPVRPATPDDRDHIVELTVAAFESDPQLRWWFPNDDRYAELAPLFFGTIVDHRLQGGYVDVHHALDGAAQWNQPGGIDVPDDEQAQAWERFESVADDISKRRLAIFEELFDHHVPDEPHWYLGIVAVRPHRQGAGIGRSLVSAGCARADEQSLPCFLESTAAKNVPLYESLGFRITAEEQLEDGPHVWFMTRPPNAA